MKSVPPDRCSWVIGPPHHVHWTSTTTADGPVDRYTLCDGTEIDADDPRIRRSFGRTVAESLVADYRRRRAADDAAADVAEVKPAPRTRRLKPSRLAKWEAHWQAEQADEGDVGEADIRGAAPR